MSTRSRNELDMEVQHRWIRALAIRRKLETKKPEAPAGSSKLEETTTDADDGRDPR